MFCLFQKSEGLDWPGHDGIRPAVRRAFPGAPRMRADRDDGDRSLFRVLLEQGAELFAAHPGHIKIDDDEINAHRTMDLKHFISRNVASIAS